MRDEREKLDGREKREPRRTCQARRTLLSRRASPETLAFLASPARRASRAPCGHSSALSLTDPTRTHHTKFQSRAEAPRLIRVGLVSAPFPVALPTVPIVLHTLPHVRDQRSTPDRIASQRSYPAKKLDKKEMIHASFHQ
jgi:hypothetical protein